MNMTMTACFYLPDIGIACERTRVPYLADEAFALASPEPAIMAASFQAATAGVVKGMNLTAARSLCRGLVILPYNRPIYMQAAEAIWEVLATESNLIEPISPELVFIEIDSDDALKQTERLGRLLADRMKISIRIGVGSSKLVARHAAERVNNKGQEVITINPGMEASFLASVPIAEIDSISPKTKEKLERLGVKTLGDVLRLPDQALRYQFKGVATLLRRLAVGDDNDRVRACWPPPFVQHSVPFDEDIESVEQLHTVLRMISEKIANELVGQQTYCRTLTLTLTLADGSMIAERGELKLPVNQARELAAGAKRLLKRLTLDRAVQTVTLKVTGLGTGSGHQLTLLEDESSEEFTQERMRRIEAALAFVRARYGISGVVLASLLHQARALDLWVSPFAHRKKESILVATSVAGAPLRMYRDNQTSGPAHCYEVTDIFDQWKQASWAWDAILETSCWRIQTDPFGQHQIEQLGVAWSLTASSD
jgi:DNA polymerase IV